MATFQLRSILVVWVLYVNLKPCIGVCSSFGIPIMVHFGVMAGILVLKNMIRTWVIFTLWSILVRSTTLLAFQLWFILVLWWYFDLETPSGVYNFLGILIMINSSCVGVYINMKPCVGICSFLGIPIMTHSSWMGSCLYLNPTLGVYNSIGISIMTHFGCMDGYLYLQLALRIYNSYNYDAFRFHGWLCELEIEKVGL
jgi:hypothetical protein